MAILKHDQLLSISGIEFKSVMMIERGSTVLIQIECDRDGEAALFSALGGSSFTVELPDKRKCKASGYSLEDGFVEILSSYLAD